jgi:hypothetical protein
VVNRLTERSASLAAEVTKGKRRLIKPAACQSCRREGQVPGGSDPKLCYDLSTECLRNPTLSFHEGDQNVCPPGSSHEALHLFPLVHRLPGAHCAQPQGLAYEAIPIHLTRWRRPAFGRVSRHQSAGPRASLVLDSGEVLTQSLAIVDYLEETHPNRRCCPPTRCCAPTCARSRR